MNYRLLISAALLGSLSLTATAASLTEIASDGRVTRLYIDAGKGRMESSGDPGFLLVDDQAETLIMVMPDKGKAMDMSRFLKNTAAPPGPETHFEPRGEGPAIAGYATSHYDYSVAGQPCGSLYVSQQALADSGASALVQAMERMAAGNRAMSTGNTDPCARGRGNISKAIANLGLPMRIADTTGRVASEVVKVDTDATLPEHAFDIPPGIELEDAAKLQAMAQQYQQQIDAMMKKAEQSGRLSPQMLEEIRRARAFEHRAK